MQVSDDSPVSAGTSERIRHQRALLKMPWNSHCDILGWSSFMATVGSALVCSVLRAFSSGVSCSEMRVPEPVDLWDFSDLKLKPRLRRLSMVGRGGGDAIVI